MICNTRQAPQVTGCDRISCFCSTANISASPAFAIISVTMSDNPEKWIELYTSAMLELKHALMAGRILEARTSIAARIEKLQGMPGLHERELQALADALCNLRTLERIELHANVEQHREAVRNALEKVGVHRAGDRTTQIWRRRKLIDFR